MKSLIVPVKQARLAIAKVHGFLPVDMRKGKSGVHEIFLHHKCIQSDPIYVAGRNADLTLQSRIIDYRQEYLSDLLYMDRKVFEYFCKMMSILPIETFPIFKRKMAGFSNRPGVKSFFRKHRKEFQQVIRLLEGGSISSKDLTKMSRIEWGWGRRTNVGNVILTHLWVSGKVMIHHREGNMKYYTLTEQVIPEKILEQPAPGKEEDAKEICRLIVLASRLVSPSGAPEQWYDVGKTSEVRKILESFENNGELFSFKVEGRDESLYAPVEDRVVWENPQVSDSNYVRFLAPLDPLLWSRKIFRFIYETDYCWEVYKKPKDRVYGYYCLPVLFNSNFIGLLEPFYRKVDRVLEIRNFYILNKSVNRVAFTSALGIELTRFCLNLGANKVYCRTKESKKWVGNIKVRES